MHISCYGEKYYEIGDAIEVRGWNGCPAVVTNLFMMGDQEWYEIKVDTANHPDAYDENGEKFNSIIERRPVVDFF